MKKIPTLFQRLYDGGYAVGMSRKVTEGCEWVLNGDGIATEKVDGMCCAIIGGKLYKRVIQNVGRRLPAAEMIPCQFDPDPVTREMPYWVRIREQSVGDKWLISAYNNTPWNRKDGTYEAVGKHFNANPYHLDSDFLEEHGRIHIRNCPRDYDGLKRYLGSHQIEGIVFYRGNGEMCKIKRRDFGFPWPVFDYDD